MNSIFSYTYRTDAYMPVVRAYYDRADMVATTLEKSAHLHSVSEFMYVVQGRANILVHPDAALTVGKRQYIWLDAFVSHQLTMDTKGQLSMINMEFDLMPALCGCPTLGQLFQRDAAMADMLNHPVPYLVQSDPDERVYGLLKQIIRLESSGIAETDSLSSHLVAALLLETARERRQEGQLTPVDNRFVSTAARYIEENYQRPITALALAQSLHVHPSYLHRLFKRHLGHSIHEHLQNVRMRAACALLAETAGDLSDIAAAVGFTSQPYFVKLFKRVYGVSPSTYRKQHNQ